MSISCLCLISITQMYLFVQLLYIFRNFYVLYFYVSMISLNLFQDESRRGVARVGPGTGNIWTTDGDKVYSLYVSQDKSPGKRGVARACIGTGNIQTTDGDKVDSLYVCQDESPGMRGVAQAGPGTGNIQTTEGDKVYRHRPLL